MLGFLSKGLKKILGSKSDKDLKELYPYIKKINDEFDMLFEISDQELRNKTKNFKDLINSALKSSSKQIKSLKEAYKSTEEAIDK